MTLFLLLALQTISGAIGACRRDERGGTEPAQGKHAPWFEEVAHASKVGFAHSSGATGHYYLPESVSGGVCLFDFNGDGYQDLYLVQSGSLDDAGENRPGNALFENRGNGSFQDVTVAARVGDTAYGMGCSCADYDNDGDVDLYVTNLGPNVLYRNNGDGTFTDVSDATGVADPSWSSSSAFGDYDNDGHLDLFVVNYLEWSRQQERTCRPSGHRDYCAPTNYNAPARDTLYHNNGDGTLSDVTRQAGIGKAFGNGLGVACGDFNGDGLLDFYVANDQTANQLWINAGTGRFTNEALLSGCALNGEGVAEAGMGVAVVDIEPDGDLDLFLSHLHTETNTFYVNRGTWFEDFTATMGLGVPSMGLTGFGLGFADFDHDGRLDLFVANGAIARAEPIFRQDDLYAEPNLLFRGLADNQFEPVKPRGGTAELLIRTSRASALGDLDNDGDIDIVVVNRDAPVHVLRNIAEKRGNWIMFRVLNRFGSDALGAQLRITAGDRELHRIVFPSYGYCSSNDPRIHCGLGEQSTVDKVAVRWPSGTETSLGPFAAGGVYVLREKSGR